MSEPFIGEIKPFAFSYVPAGYALCDGSILQISEHTTLFSIIGSNFGGDGINTFALPDLRGRAPSGPAYPVHLGFPLGVEQVSLQESEMPDHRHNFHGTTTIGNSNTPVGKTIAGSETTNLYSNQTSLADMHPGTVATTGSGEPHNNMQPSLVVNYCIAVQGTVPQHN